MANKRDEYIAVFHEAIDVAGTDHVEILVSDGPNNQPVVHINTGSGMKCRICQIRGQVIINDNRAKLKRA